MGIITFQSRRKWSAERKATGKWVRVGVERTSAIWQEIRSERTYLVHKDKMSHNRLDKETSRVDIVRDTATYTTQTRQSDPPGRIRAVPWTTLRQFNNVPVLSARNKRDRLRSSITFVLLKLKAPLYYQSGLPCLICVLYIWYSSTRSTKNDADASDVPFFMYTRKLVLLEWNIFIRNLRKWIKIYLKRFA